MVDDELRLPRVPGVIRRFWARHPVLADALIAAVCALLTLVPAATFRAGPDELPREPQVLNFVLIPLAIAACALLLRRRQWPVVVYGAALVLETAFLFAPVSVSTPLTIVASYSLAVYLSSKAAWIGYGVTVGWLGLVAVVLWMAGMAQAPVAANTVVGSAVMLLIGTLIGVNVGNRKRYVEAIIDRSRQLLVERDQQAQLAASAERARIAREMHDIVSHSLTVIVALAEGASVTPDPDRARAATSQVAETARAALREMRAMLGVLRDDSEAAPLSPTGDDAVATVIESARRAGYPVVLRQSTSIEAQSATPQDTPRPVRLAVARIVQESVTNAMRHAVGATRIEVMIHTDQDAVVIDVRNDGVAAAVRAGGYGLRGLRERVDHVGGTLHVGPLPPDSWLVHARLPIALAQEQVAETEERSDR